MLSQSLLERFYGALLRPDVTSDGLGAPDGELTLFDVFLSLVGTTSTVEEGLGPHLLRPYQWELVQKIKDIKGIILAVDMGAGKTVSTLTAIRDLIDTDEVARVLIVAPLLVAETTWPDEIDDWSHTRHLTYEIITGPEDRRVNRLSHDTDIHIINRENLVWLWNFYGEGKNWPYDMVVVDEASMFKNGKRRTKGTKKLDDDGNIIVKKGNLTRFGMMAKARALTNRVVELTGTPTPKGIQNLWGLAFIADGGQRLGTSRTAFEKRWFRPDYSGFKLEPLSNATAEITERLSDIMFSLDPSDLDQLPPIVPVDHHINLPKKIKTEYALFKKTLVSEMYDVEAFNQGVLTQKLLQFANGSMYQEDRQDVWVHDEKLKVLESIHEEADGSPLFVAYSFKFDLDRIRKKFPKAVVLADEDARDVKRRWNNGEIEMLLAHPASAGHGLNFQRGGNIAVWYGLPHDLELYLQFNKRLHRPGQKNTVYLHRILAKGTIDDTLPGILEARAANQDDVLKAVRMELKRAG